MNLEELNQVFGSEAVTFQKGPGEFLTAVIRNSEAEAAICLHGAHLMKFVPAGEIPVVWMSNSSWFDPSFVDGYKNVALWGYAVADQSIEGESFTKTMYDPCPPGYMVPEYKVWYNNNAQDQYSNQGPGSIGFNNGESGWESGNGHGMVTTREYFDYNWYPLAGRREPTTGYVEDSGWFGHMWTGTPMGNFNARSLYYDSRQNHFSGQIAEAGSGGVMNTGNPAKITCGTGPAYGFPVRCMKE